MHQTKKTALSKSTWILILTATASLATGLTVVGHFTSTTTTLKRQQFSYTRPDEVALRHTNAINPRLTPWTYRNTSFSSLPLTGENPGAWALVRDNSAKGITAGSGSQQTTYDPTRTEAALTASTTFALRRYDLAGRALYDLDFSKLNPQTPTRDQTGQITFNPFGGFGLSGAAPQQWNKVKNKVPVEVAQDPSNPYRFAVLLVPRSVVYYEQLQRGLGLPQQRTESGQNTSTTGAMFGLKVKNAEADTAKSNEKLQGAEATGSSTTSGSGQSTQRGGSSGDTKVKALKIEVKKKSDSEDNGQLQLEKNDLANAPIKRSEESGQSVQLKADDFGTALSSSGSGGNSNPGSPTPWRPWLATEQIHKDLPKWSASILILYDAPYARNRTAIDRVDHLDPKAMTANYPPSWRTPKWNHHGLWDWKARDVLLQTTGFFNPRRHPEWFDGGQTVADNEKTGFDVDNSENTKQGFQKEADSDKSAPIALPFEAYFANIGNLTWFGQALLVFGGNGHVTKSAHTAPLSIGVFRVRYNATGTSATVTGWPYALLFSGMVNKQTDGLKDLPFNNNRWFEYVPRMAVAGAKFVGRELVLAGTITMGDTATVPRLLYDELESNLNLVAQGQGLLREDLQLFTPYGWANRPDLPIGAWSSSSSSSSHNAPYYFHNNPDWQDRPIQNVVDAFIKPWEDKNGKDDAKYIYPYRYSGMWAWQVYNWSNKLTDQPLSADFVNENAYQPNSLFAAILNPELLAALPDKVKYGKENEFAANEYERFNQKLTVAPTQGTNWSHFSPTLSRFSTGFNLVGSVLDQVLDYVPWIGNGYRYGNNHRGVDDITAPQTSAGSSSGISTNTSGSRSFLPTFSNIGVGLKANVQATLGGSQTMITGGSPRRTLDQANLQLWTGAGWRNDKASSGQSDENHTKFTSATGMDQQGQSGTSAGNPDSLKQDNISKSGDSLTTQDGNAIDQQEATNYTNLPPNLTPTADWPNALSFTNKNNAQRAQLFLRGLLGSIPVLVNRSGSDSNKFQATDQKWSYTDLHSDQTKLNLPAYGEVNGLLNPALVETYFGNTRAGGSGSNTTSSPGIGFKIPEQNNDSKATLITPGLAWTPQDVGNLVVSGTTVSFQLGGWLVTFTDFVKPRAGYLGLQLTGLDASDATQRALIWAPRPWAAFRGSWVNRLGRVESVWDLKGVWADQAQSDSQGSTTTATRNALPEHPNALAFQVSVVEASAYKPNTSSGQTQSTNSSPYLHLVKPKKVTQSDKLDDDLKNLLDPNQVRTKLRQSFGTDHSTQPQPQSLKTTTPVFGTSSGNLSSVLSGGGAGGGSSGSGQSGVDLSPVEKVSGWLVGQLPSTSDGNTSSTNNLAPNTNTGNDVVGVGRLSESNAAKMNDDVDGIVRTPLAELLDGEGQTADTGPQSVKFKSPDQIDFNRLFTHPVTDLFDPVTMLVYDQYIPLFIDIPASVNPKMVRLKVLSFDTNEQSLGLRLEFFKPDQDTQPNNNVQVNPNNGDFLPLLTASSQGPQTLFSPFNQWPDYVLPLAITVPIVVIVLSVTLGLAIGIPMHKNKQALKAGFALSNQKVDVLTKAVGSVFKEIINRTGISQAPKRLKQTSAAKPGAPRPPVPPKPGAPKPPVQPPKKPA
ncbi:adhesin P1 [Mycoplasmoides pneumoniae]|nr:adhesin P1 [Mycoplasmoides pneumoniae]ALA32140.1 adhesin [Mycoplasmoides pneumoniae 51494]ALA33545.1 adhesin [Mycoplasmoides pneumoniae 54524]